MKRVATPEYTYEGLLSLYTRLDKSYTIFLQRHILKSSYSFWIFIRQIVMHSKVKEYCTGLRKQSQFTYNNKILNLYSRSGNRGPSVWSRIPKSSVHCYPSVVRRCATFIQAAGLQRLHANTSHYYFFLFFFSFFSVWREGGCTLVHSGPSQPPQNGTSGESALGLRWRGSRPPQEGEYI